jgi:hypothetical protein
MEKTTLCMPKFVIKIWVSEFSLKCDLAYVKMMQKICVSNRGSYTYFYSKWQEQLDMKRYLLKAGGFYIL